MNTASTSRRTPPWNADFSQCWSTLPQSKTASPFCGDSRNVSRCITGYAFRTTPWSAQSLLSNRYIADRFLPDKAIDLVDEACAMVRTEIDSMPAELDEVTRRVMQLEIEGCRPEKGKGQSQ